MPEREKKFEIKLSVSEIIDGLLAGKVLQLSRRANNKQLFLTVKHIEINSYDELAEEWQDYAVSVLIYEGDSWDDSANSSLVAHRDLLVARADQQATENYIFSEHRLRTTDHVPDFLQLDEIGRQRFILAFQGSNNSVQRKTGEEYKIGLGELMQAIAVAIAMKKSSPRILKTGFDLSKDGEKLWAKSGVVFDKEEGVAGVACEIDYEKAEEFCERVLVKNVGMGAGFI